MLYYWCMNSSTCLSCLERHFHFHLIIAQCPKLIPFLLTKWIKSSDKMLPYWVFGPGLWWNANSKYSPLFTNLTFSYKTETLGFLYTHALIILTKSSKSKNPLSSTCQFNVERRVLDFELETHQRPWFNSQWGNFLSLDLFCFHVVKSLMPIFIYCVFVKVFLSSSSYSLMGHISKALGTCYYLGGRISVSPP